MTNDGLTIDELTEVADQMENEGRLEEAYELWAAAANKVSDPIVLCRFGDLAMRLGKTTEAEQAFLSASKLDPNLPNPYNQLGMLYFEEGRLNEAEAQFKRSLTIERTASTLTLLGVVHLELALITDARENFEDALRIDKNYEEACYNMGLTYREEQPSRAIELFEKAIEIDSEYALAHRELGWAYRGLGNYPEAEYHLLRSIELDDSDAWAHIYLGNTLWAEGDSNDAEECFKKSVAVWPDESVPYWCLALFYEYENRPDDALKLYDQALRIDPEDPVANKAFGKYLLDTGQYEKARLYLRKALALNAGD